MTIPANSLVQGQIVMQQQGQKFSNVLHWSPSDTIPTPDEVSNLQEVLNQWVSKWRTPMADVVEFLGAVFSLPQDPSFGTRTLTLTGQFGAQSAPPGQTTSYAIIRKYAISDSKSTRGRVLFAGFPESFTEQNVLTNAGFLNFVDPVSIVASGFATADSDWEPQIYSRLGDVFNPVIKANVDPTVRSLHSRQATLI